MSFITPYLSQKQRITEDTTNCSFAFFAVGVKSVACLESMYKVQSIRNKVFPFGGDFNLNVKNSQTQDRQVKYLMAENEQVRLLTTSDANCFLSFGFEHLSVIWNVPKRINEVLVDNFSNIYTQKGRVERVYLYENKERKNYSVKVRFWYKMPRIIGENLTNRINSVLEDL